MGRARKENKIRSSRRRAGKDTSGTKERPKKKNYLLDGPRSLCLVIELEGERYCPQ